MTTSDPSQSQVQHHADPSSHPDTFAHVQRVWNRLLTTSPVYAFFLPTMRLVHCSPSLLRGRLLLGANHINSKHTLHGSVSACLVDWAGGLVLATVPLEDGEAEAGEASGKERRYLEATGLSTDLNVSFVGGAKEGEELEIEAQVLRLGRNLGFTRVEIRKVGKDGEKGEVVAVGGHTKYVKREPRPERQGKE